MRRYTFIALALLIITQSGFAQDAPATGAQAEHQWLQKFVGEWESESTAGGPDGAEFHGTGTMVSRMIGDLWVVSELTGKMGEVTITGVQTIGYDPQKKKYVGTWIDSMMNYMWSYEGTVDETGMVLTLEAKGPNFIEGGKIATFRDSYEFKSPDHIVAISSILTDDGTWVTFMTGDMRRKK